MLKFKQSCIQNRLKRRLRPQQKVSAFIRLVNGEIIHVKLAPHFFY